MYVKELRRCLISRFQLGLKGSLLLHLLVSSRKGGTDWNLSARPSSTTPPSVVKLWLFCWKINKRKWWWIILKEKSTLFVIAQEMSEYSCFPNVFYENENMEKHVVILCVKHNRNIQINLFLCEYDKWKWINFFGSEKFLRMWKFSKFELNPFTNLNAFDIWYIFF